MDPREAEALLQSGITALRNGDGSAARDKFERISAEGGTPPWLLLARACNMLNDAAGEEAALERQLELDKRDLPALLAMGALKARGGDARAASTYFQAALATATATPQLPAHLHPQLQQAQAFLGEINRGYEAHLISCLQDAGMAVTPPRVQHALDLLLGKVSLYQQEPSMFYFPGLPQRQFFEREEFSWISEFESRVAALQEELTSVLASEADFGPYVVRQPGRPAPNNPLLGDPSWGAYYFWQSGMPVEPHAANCPQTMAALALAPMPRVAGRSPIALYSLLKPGTHIAPHNGMLNTRLICHLPLIAPEGCALRVGSETRMWKEGETLIFDDSFEHEAWNRSDRTRIILLFEIWRPEISAEERILLTRLFEAIDLFPMGADG